jgi:hypothetical protein
MKSMTLYEAIKVITEMLGKGMPTRERLALNLALDRLKQSPLSEFVRASDEHRAKVMEGVGERAAERQQAILDELVAMNQEMGLYDDPPDKR